MRSTTAELWAGQDRHQGDRWRLFGAVGLAVRAREVLYPDYTSGLPFVEDSFDLLVSLYAGPISRHCTRYLRVGGTLLVNPSHGDVAFASLDNRYELCGVVRSRSENYSVSTDDLDSYLVPRKDGAITVESIERSGRGVAHTKSAFAYLFRRVR